MYTWKTTISYVLCATIWVWCTGWIMDQSSSSTFLFCLMTNSIGHSLNALWEYFNCFSSQTKMSFIVDHWCKGEFLSLQAIPLSCIILLYKLWFSTACFYSLFQSPCSKNSLTHELAVFVVLGFINFQGHLQELDEGCKTPTTSCFFAKTTSNAHFKIGTRFAAQHVWSFIILHPMLWLQVSSNLVVPWA